MLFRSAGFNVVLVEQPYRVAGRKTPAPAGQLDTAWLAVLADLRKRGVLTDPLIAGGRSMSARVACRTAAQADAAAEACLAFPGHPPGKADDPTKSRQGELDAVSVPGLVIQGVSDPFGMPTADPGHEVVTVAGNHGLKKDLDAGSEPDSGGVGDGSSTDGESGTTTSGAAATGSAVAGALPRVAAGLAPRSPRSARACARARARSLSCSRCGTSSPW